MKLEYERRDFPPNLNDEMERIFKQYYLANLTRNGESPPFVRLEREGFVN